MTSTNRVFAPTYVRVKGKEAWRQNLQLTALAADKIRSCLGPKGAYKMITYNRGPEQVTKITKDAVSVLEELAIQNPSVTIICEAAKMQREEVGDGVTSFVILLSGLLKKADELSSLGIHRNTILRGYLEATKKTLELIDAQASKLNDDELDKVLQTVDCGRGLLTAQLRRLVIDASKLAVKDGKLDRNKVRIVKKPGGSIPESKLINGIITKKEKAHPSMPDKVKDAKIAIISSPTSMKRLEIKMPGEGRFPIQLSINDPSQIAKYKEAENEFRLLFLGKVESAGANTLVCQQPLDDKLKNGLANRDIFALETVDAEDIKALSEAAGAHICGNIKELSEQDLGYAETLEVDTMGREKMVTFSGCNGVTFLLRGTTSQALDECEKIIRNGITCLKTALEDSRTLLGGGATEMHIANRLSSFAKEFSGREQLAIQAFADALVDIPKCLAENNGLDPTDAIIDLKNHHAKGFGSYGVGASGCSDNVCLELAKTKISVIKRAYEVASLMLRIDEQVTSKEIAKFHKK